MSPLHSRFVTSAWPFLMRLHAQQPAQLAHAFVAAANTHAWTVGTLAGQPNKPKGRLQWAQKGQHFHAQWEANHGRSKTDFPQARRRPVSTNVTVHASFASHPTACLPLQRTCLSSIGQPTSWSTSPPLDVASQSCHTNQFPTHKEPASVALLRDLTFHARSLLFLSFPMPLQQLSAHQGVSSRRQRDKGAWKSQKPWEEASIRFVSASRWQGSRRQWATSN